jgi:hypothetical protein
MICDSMASTMRQGPAGGAEVLDGIADADVRQVARSIRVRWPAAGFGGHAERDPRECAYSRFESA